MTARSSGALRFGLSAEHPALAGHFPGRPLAPGVLLLDLLLEAAMGDGAACRIESAKFLSALMPGEEAELVWRADGAFSASVKGRPVARGRVRPAR
ncbi:MAG: hypothetical protein FWD12_05190 [Alphaproteobacteria bacterium]|nr:hypothetical protein [Alphaproteobacteria bacterium]